MFFWVVFEVILTEDVAATSLVVWCEGLKGKIDHLINAKNISTLFFYRDYSTISDMIYHKIY